MVIRRVTIISVSLIPYHPYWYIDCWQPIKGHRYIITFFFWLLCLLFLLYSKSPLIYMYVLLRESMSFGLIGISSLSLQSTTYCLISLYFTIITFFIPFFTFVFACFILSFLFLGVVILIILVHRGQPYHSIHFILWHWFEDLNLRGYLTRRGSYVHQWWRRACSFLVFSHWSLIY